VDGNLKGYTALRARLDRVGHVDAGLLKMLGLQTVREAKQRVPRKTGNLGRSIAVIATTPTSVKVGARANYGGYVELGTKAHDITPNAARALRFATPGGARLTGSPKKGASVVFAMRVHHPGTKPHPYLVPGAKAAIEGVGLGKIIVAAWEGRK
jgi:hypothetical protein